MKNQFSRASEKIRSHFFSRFFEIETLVNDWFTVLLFTLLHWTILHCVLYCTVYYTLHSILISYTAHCTVYYIALDHRIGFILCLAQQLLCTLYSILYCTVYTVLYCTGPLYRCCFTLGLPQQC